MGFRVRGFSGCLGFGVYRVPELSQFIESGDVFV